MKDCVSCVHEYLSSTSDTCRECGIAMLNYEEAKPKSITNADKIRAMTDEELAYFMANIEPCRESAWLDWLKQEANDAN